ncbi:hypothetical protein QFZ94_002408 [Paraburkholderia sp. JPY465]
MIVRSRCVANRTVGHETAYAEAFRVCRHDLVHQWLREVASAIDHEHDAGAEDSNARGIAGLSPARVWIVNAVLILLALRVSMLVS